MQTRRDREALLRRYALETISPKRILGGSMAGLLVTAAMAAHGFTVSPDDAAIADRIEQERGRLAVTHAATEHSQAVYSARESRYAIYLAHGREGLAVYAHDAR